ncbi:uncharacterized protein TNCV_2446061 [Trichonephila clavipes]|nr:uncharacterized protein TNCV_2446061 [Trichonephila clavipes]
MVQVPCFTHYRTYFFERGSPQELTSCSVNGERYLEMLQTYLISTFQQLGCLQEIIFMHEGTPPHIASSIQKLLRQAFTDARVISRSFPTAGPLRLPDLTPCDFWLRSLLKDNVYRERLNMKNCIHCHINSLHIDSLRSAIEGLIFRIERVVART